MSSPTSVDEVEPSAKTTNPTSSIFTAQKISLPDQILPKPECIVVLDQGQEGSAVGHGMATMINYLLRERGIYEQISARMLQQLSKQYGDQPLDQDQGSMLINGMRG